MNNQIPDNQYQGAPQHEQQQNTQQQAAPQQAPMQTGRKPDQIAYNVQDSPDGKGYWNRVGAVWHHQDGRGSEIILNSIPVDGRITLREQREQRMQNYQDQRNAQASVAQEQVQSHEPQR